MIEYNQVHQMMVFFTGKNFLVVILQIYRLVVLQVSFLLLRKVQLTRVLMEKM